MHDAAQVFVDGKLQSKVLESAEDTNGFGYWKVQWVYGKLNYLFIIIYWKIAIGGEMKCNMFVQFIFRDAELTLSDEGGTLDILVENLGRINYG